METKNKFNKSTNQTEKKKGIGALKCHAIWNGMQGKAPNSINWWTTTTNLVLSETIIYLLCVLSTKFMHKLYWNINNICYNNNNQSWNQSIKVYAIHFAELPRRWHDGLFIWIQSECFIWLKSKWIWRKLFRDLKTIRPRPIWKTFVSCSQMAFTSRSRKLTVTQSVIYIKSTQRHHQNSSQKLYFYY